MGLHLTRDRARAASAAVRARRRGGRPESTGQLPVRLGARAVRYFAQPITPCSPGPVTEHGHAPSHARLAAPVPTRDDAIRGGRPGSGPEERSAPPPPPPPRSASCASGGRRADRRLARRGRTRCRARDPGSCRGRRRGPGRLGHRPWRVTHTRAGVDGVKRGAATAVTAGRGTLCWSARFPSRAAGRARKVAVIAITAASSIQRGRIVRDMGSFASAEAERLVRYAEPNLHV